MTDILAGLLDRRGKLTTQLQSLRDTISHLDHVIEEFRDGNGASHGDNGASHNGNGASHGGNGDSHPGCDLSFARILRAIIAGKEYLNPRWNHILTMLAEQLKTKGEFSRLVTSKWEQGERNGSGDIFMKDLDITYHGKSAPAAWKSICTVARYLGIKIDIEFEWQNTPKAQYPGKSGRLSV